MSEAPHSDTYSHRDHLLAAVQFQEDCLREIETSLSAQKKNVVSAVNEFRAFLREDKEHKDPIADLIILRFPREEWNWRIQLFHELEKQLAGLVGKTVCVKERERVATGDSELIYQTNFCVGVLKQDKLVFTWGEDNCVYLPTEKHVYFTKRGTSIYHDPPPSLIQGNVKLSLGQIEIRDVGNDNEYLRVLYQEEMTRALELLDQ